VTITKRVELRKVDAAKGLGTATSMLSDKNSPAPELRVQLVATHRRPSGIAASQMRAGAKPEGSGHVFATLLPSWKADANRITVVTPRPQKATAQHDAMGHYNSADTRGIGPGGAAGVVGIGGN
jgi:hypothetical protein